MSDNYYLIKECVKLEGISNYSQFVDAFQALCHTYDEGYWDIYTGFYQPRISIKIDLAPEECRNRCAEAFNSTPETVIDREIAEWTMNNVDIPNVGLDGWELKHCHVLTLINRPIDKSVAGLIHDEKHAYKINARFASAFGGVTRDS